MSWPALNPRHRPAPEPVLPKRVAIPGIQVVRVKKRGKVYEYHYHRATRTRINAEPGTVAFAAEVHALDEKLKADVAGSLLAMMGAYQASDEFQDLADRTKKDYRRVMQYLEPLGEDDPGDYTPMACIEIRDDAKKAHGWRFAKYVVQVGSILWKWGILREYVATNPWAGVPAPKRPKHLGVANRPWTAQELVIALMAAHPGLARGLALCAMGRDASDAIRIQWSDVDLGEMDRGKTGASGRIVVPQALASVFDGERPSDYVTTHSGKKPWKTQNTFTQGRRELMATLAKQGLVRPGLTTHGLRKTLASILTEGGAELRTVQTALQHKTLAMALHYAAEADMTKRNDEAMKLLSDALSDAGFEKP